MTGNGWVQVLVATSTLAWGVNTPAHLVIIKGTEYFDAPSRHVPSPYTCQLKLASSGCVCCLCYMGFLLQAWQSAFQGAHAAHA